MAAAVAGLAAFAVAAAFASHEMGGLGGDDAEYVLLAKAIREQGAYVTTWAPGGPAPHTLYPPVLPLLLAPFAGAAPGSFLAIHLVLAAAGGAAVALLALVFARRGLPPVAAGAAALAAALSPLWIRCAADVLSELPFLAFVAAALLALETPEGAPRTARRIAAAAALAALAFLTRTAGIALVPWVVWELVRRPRGGGRAGWASAAALVAVVAVWFARGAALGAENSYAGQLAEGDGAAGAILPRMWSALVEDYLPGLPAFVFPHVGPVWDVAGWALWALAAVGLVAGVLRTRRVRALDGHLVTALAMICAWGFRDPRFAVPLAPFVVLLAGEGLAAALARVPAAARFRGTVLAAAALACVAPNAVHVARRTLPRASRPTPPVPGLPDGAAVPRAAAFHETWGDDDAQFARGGVSVASYVALCRAIREEPSAPRGPLFASNPRVAALLTGRPCLHPLDGDTVDSMIARMRAAGADLVLADSFTDPRSSAVREIVRRRGDGVTVVAQIGDAWLFRLSR